MRMGYTEEVELFKKKVLAIKAAGGATAAQIKELAKERAALDEKYSEYNQKKKALEMKVLEKNAAPTPSPGTAEVMFNDARAKKAALELADLQDPRKKQIADLALWKELQDKANREEENYNRRSPNTQLVEELMRFVKPSAKDSSGGGGSSLVSDEDASGVAGLPQFSLLDRGANTTGEQTWVPEPMKIDTKKVWDPIWNRGHYEGVNDTTEGGLLIPKIEQELEEAAATDGLTEEIYNRKRALARMMRQHYKLPNNPRLMVDFNEFTMGAKKRRGL